MVPQETEITRMIRVIYLPLLLRAASLALSKPMGKMGVVLTCLIFYSILTMDTP